MRQAGKHFWPRRESRRLALAFTLSLSGLAPADEAVFELGSIMVVGDTPRIVESLTTVDEISAQDIQASGARNLAEALRLLPGLYVRTGPDGTARIEIRGLRTRQIMLLLDGVPINSAIDGQFDPASIDLANLERIRVSRGASSVLYGAGGNAGVIDLVTRAGSASFNASLKSELDLDGARQGQVSAAGGGRDWKAFASLSGHQRNHYELSGDYAPLPVTGKPDNFQPAGKRLNSDRRDLSLYGNFSWSGLDRTTVGVSATYRKGEYGKPTETRDFSGADADPYARRPRFERVDDFEGFSASLTARHAFETRLQLRSSLYFNRLDELTNNYDDASYSSQTLERTLSSDARADIYGGSLLASYDLAGLGLASLAADCRRETWKASGFEVSATAAGGGGGGGGGGGNTATKRVPVDIDEQADVCSAAYEQELRIGNSLGLLGGVSYARQDRAEGEGDDGAGYLFGAYWDFSEGTRVRASHARKIRFPTLRDLFEPGRANPGLSAETTSHYELGAEHSFTAVPATLGVTGFRIDALDYIEADRSGVAQNTEKDRFRGVEVSTRITPSDNFSVRAGYTWQKSENLSAGVTNPDLPNRPEHQFKLEAGYLIPRWGVSMHASWQRIAGSLELSRGSAPSSRKIGDYDVVAMKVQKNVGDFYFYIRADNLFDADYAESGGFPAPGRSVLLGAGAVFGS